MCPCPVGVEAMITITKFWITLVKATKILGGKRTSNAFKFGEESLDVKFDFKNKTMGILESGSVSADYILTVYYKNPRDKKCCQDGTVNFKGNITFSGSYVSGKNKVTVKKAVAPIKATQNFGTCPKNSVPQCVDDFPGKYNTTYSFKFPDTRLVPNWRGFINITGDFTVTITTKKTK